jgi:hypothetical protein
MIFAGAGAARNTSGVTWKKMKMTGERKAVRLEGQEVQARR